MSVLPGLRHLSLKVFDCAAVGVLLAHNVEELLLRDQVGPGEHRRGLCTSKRHEGRRRPAPDPMGPPGEIQRVRECERDVAGRGRGVPAPFVHDCVAGDAATLHIGQEPGAVEV